MHGVSIFQNKFVFAKNLVKCVGIIVNSDGVKTESNKVKAILDFSQTLKYNRTSFIHGFSESTGRLLLN